MDCKIEGNMPPGMVSIQYLPDIFWSEIPIKKLPVIIWELYLLLSGIVRL